MNVGDEVGGRQKIIVLGAGGHAKVVVDTLRAQGITVDGIVDPHLAKSETLWRGLNVLGSDEKLLELDTNDYLLVNGVGSLPGNNLRQKLFTKFKVAGFDFLTIIHPTAIIGAGVQLEEGVQVMAGAIIQPDCHVAKNTILNTGVTLDHDCRVGANVHIAPGVNISGDVVISDGAHVGTGASIVQGVTIGKGSLIGAGTVVVRSVPDNAKLLGQQPRLFKHKDWG